ncbi:hypothetical protein JTE90_014914 [Oedothorax gibbosus]|uniref:Chitin-binding type-2 domain-containing protein n=1 Tax=Oedothorax gibbosus TaxID=931172 RepID=A0AAV6VLB4_9ARAC|nr:hypothetical protein JTE90_014914 [Oedothorax gibbosus]
MQQLLLLWLFLVGSSIISSVQSEEINDESFEVDALVYGHDHNRQRHTTPSPKSFVCPSPSGRYPHERDCDRYYECRFGEPHLVKCDRNKLYDDKKEKCNDRHKVDCDRKDRDRTTTDSDEDDKDGHNRNRHTTPSPKSFVCPAPSGRYPHERDCDRYYECRFGVPHLMKCDRNKLYDDKKEKCNDQHKVDCDRKDRDRTTTDYDEDDTDSDEDDKELDHDETFKCPYPYGTFTHPTLCHKYYVCRNNIPSLFQCQGSKLFDTRDRKCSDRRRVRCGDRFDRDDLKTSKRPTTKFPSTTPQPQKKTTLPRISTTTEESHRIFCRFRNGRYPDPLDCSQYYECHSYFTTLYKCPRSTLYDERKEKCMKDTQVKCGDRPGGIGGDLTTKQPKTTFRTTTAAPKTKTAAPTTTEFPKTAAPTTTEVPITEAPTSTVAPVTAAPTTTEVPITAAPSSTVAPVTAAPTTTEAPITAAPTSTVAPVTAAPTTTEAPITAAPTSTVAPVTAAPTTTTEAPITAAPTTPAPITKVTKPNTPPPTECDEDDLDCIIDKTGDIRGWFECPERYGHFAHGSSRQLFIHCDNYRPYVKKCPDNTVFSQENLVCIWIGNPGEIIE